MKFSHYAVIQDGFTIYGTGISENDAINDAIQYMDADTDISEIESGFTTVYGNLCVVPCTLELHEFVQKYGAPNNWGEIRGKGIYLKGEDEADE